MPPIISPLSHGDNGSEIVNLHKLTNDRSPPPKIELLKIHPDYPFNHRAGFKS